MMADETLKASIEKLRCSGFIVGDRDPNMNRAFAGAFMVCEPVSDGDPYPTDDASDGRWCVVGDDLAKLVMETIWFFELND